MRHKQRAHLNRRMITWSSSIVPKVKLESRFKTLKGFMEASVAKVNGNQLASTYTSSYSVCNNNRFTEHMNALRKKVNDEVYMHE